MQQSQAELSVHQVPRDEYMPVPISRGGQVICRSGGSRGCGCKPGSAGLNGDRVHALVGGWGGFDLEHARVPPGVQNHLGSTQHLQPAPLVRSAQDIRLHELCPDHRDASALVSAGAGQPMPRDCIEISRGQQDSGLPHAASQVHSAKVQRSI